jgi:hypothetical protein
LVVVECVARELLTLRSVSITGAALGAGFRNIDGEGVAKLVDRPERVTLFNLSDIYRPIVGAERP